jgi:hypothetical protein
MANGRLSMRKIKEVLRLHQEIGLSARQIAKSCDISRSERSSGKLCIEIRGQA